RRARFPADRCAWDGSEGDFGLGWVEVGLMRIIPGNTADDSGVDYASGSNKFGTSSVSPLGDPRLQRLHYVG
ncbi:MAG: hypothetical protein COA78_19695, partial [Blastopirellula sp.]